MKIIITKGIPASGKSTWAKQKVKEGKGKWKRITKDYLRYMLDETQFSQAREEFIKKARDLLLEAILSEGCNCIIDDTNLHPKHETRIREIAKEYNAEVEVKWFPIHIEDALRRNKRREGRVPDDVIYTMYKNYVKAGGPVAIVREEDPTPIYNKNLPTAIVCDLDGSLCLFDHHRGPYETEKCANDRINEPIAHILGRYLSIANIILMSGRDRKHEEQTRQCLDRNKIRYDSLFMRDIDDRRNDAIIKRELYEKHIRGKYNVLFVLDDRLRCVEMWRALGITCLQVNYGRF